MKGSAFWRMAPLLLILGLGALVLLLGLHRHLTPEHLYDNRALLKAYIAANFWLALLLYMLLYIVIVALSLPGALLLSISGGFLFGWQVATPAIVVAATLGATLMFLSVRTAFGKVFAERAGPWLGKLRMGLQQDAMSYMLFLRLVPAFPFFVVNIAPALLGVPLSTYVIATAVGILPGTLAFAFAGSGLDGVLAAQGARYEACRAAAGSDAAAAGSCRLGLDLGALVSSEVLIALVLLAAVSLVPILWKRLGSSGRGP